MASEFPRVKRVRVGVQPSPMRVRRRAGLLAVLLAFLAPFVGPMERAVADELTVSQDALRTGWDAQEPSLSAAAIRSSSFGQLFTAKVTGQVYAQPLVIGGTVIVSTEDDWVYGLDAVTGTVKWSRNLGPTWPSSTIGCADLAPNIGNTSTGVYDRSTGLVYLTTKVNNGPDALSPNWYLHALSATTGAEVSGWPVRITGTPSNDPVHPFNGKDLNQRPGLLLMNGVVYMAFGSQCDYGTYVGLVAGVNTSTRAISMWSDESGTTSSKAGIWQGGGGIVSDGPGRMFVSTGNGVTAPDGPGTSPPSHLSQSVVRLGVNASGVIAAQDFFSPANAAVLDRNDEDLGSGGPVALPSQYFGTPSVPHLMVEIGKEGRLFLLNRDHLGGKAQGPGGTDDVVQALGPYRGVWGHPAVYGGEGGYVYVVQTNGAMLAFKSGTDGQGRPALSLAGQTTETFGYTSGSPAVTSNGLNAGSAVVWVVNVDGPTGTNGRLCAYAAVPTNGHISLLRCFPIGTGVKFSTPATSNGRVYVGTRDGFVFGFGQPASSALNAQQTNFGNVNVGSTKHATVVATASRTVTVNSVSTAAPFAATALAAPVTLAAGQTIKVDVSFSPNVPGSATGALQFAVVDRGSPAGYGAALQGMGIKPGFTASPAQLDFGQVPVGANKALTATFTNFGTADETVTSVTGPSQPFTMAGAPAYGAVISPGQSIAVSITYTPTAVAHNTSSVTITGPHGSAAVSLLGSGVTGTAKLTISPAAMDFGSVSVGRSVSQTLTVTNTGNLDVTITKAAPPALPFVVATPLPEGQVLVPGDVVRVIVTFAPTAVGSYSNAYTISSDDGRGEHVVPVTGVGTSPAAGVPLPSLVGGGWVLNGSAAVSGTTLVLTTPSPNQVGSAALANPVPSAGLDVSFTAQISGGTGADGLTFALLDATRNTPRSMGTGGGGLGFLGLAGVAVTLDTYKGGNDPSANFIGLTTGGINGALTYVSTAPAIPPLRTGTHSVHIAVTSGRVNLSLDGSEVLAANMTVPASVLPAFTGATGGLTDKHAVSDVVVRSGSTLLPAPGTGWRFNGAATASAGEAVVTPAQVNVAGSVLYSDPVPTNGLTASFALTTNGGTGADGTTFALLDAAKQSATSLGSVGSGLGFAGLAGVAVAFVTYPQNGIDSHNFVAILTSTAGGPAAVVSSTTNVPNLRTAPRQLTVGVSGTTLTVSVDGKQVLSATVPSVPKWAIVGFTASTGASTDVHRIGNAQVLAGLTFVPPPPATGWTFNGVAATVNGTLRLTQAITDQIGSAFYATAIPTARLHASFDIRIGGGTGADGMTFALVDASRAGPTSIGAGGGGLGFSGLPGVAVTFVTYKHVGEPSTNFVGISTGGSGRALTYVATSTAVPALRTGSHHVDIAVGAGGHVVVTVDGQRILDTSVAIPTKALVGFTAATGALTDDHSASAISIAY